MAETPRKVLICSCEDTMPLDIATVKRGCRNVEFVEGRYLCRTELDKFRTAAGADRDLTVTCTQEAPLFTEVAGEIENAAAVSFVNIRETAGWSADAKAAAPKMAALIAAAAEPPPEFRTVPLQSEGVILIYGKSTAAIEAAQLLKDSLDVTVLLSDPDELSPQRATEFPIVRGKIRNAKGHVGAFEVTVDDYAAPLPSSRGEYKFGGVQNGAVSRCDLILDLSGTSPLFPAFDLRDGYLRADPADPAAVLRAAFKARDLVGSFEKPKYINFHAELCAHSRSHIVGCHRCLDLCPTGAITPAGDHVEINAAICAGCGQCAAACPTGAAAYAMPAADALLRKLRTLLTAYRAAGGEQAVLLVHDTDHGGALIDALARHGDGLPANIIPVEVNEVTQVGIEAVAAAFAYGTSALRFLLRAKPRHDVAGLRRTVELAAPILAGLGFDGERVATIETDDPFALGETLRAAAPLDGTDKPGTFTAVGGKRDVMRLAMRELHAAAPAPVDLIALPAGAPFGAVTVNTEGCTLCLSCVSACPTGALSDDPETPILRFAEDACVQCGICKATCPEKVISLTPQIDFRAATSPTRVLKQEEPFRCINCDKPFGVKSSVERIVAKLEGKHWMYKDSKARLDAIKMCADCRVTVMAETGFDPIAAPPKPKVRTSDDYFRERAARGETDTGH
jgi:ferredoxin